MERWYVVSTIDSTKQNKRTTFSLSNERRGTFSFSRRLSVPMRIFLVEIWRRSLRTGDFLIGNGRSRRGAGNFSLWSRLSFFIGFGLLRRLTRRFRRRTSTFHFGRLNTNFGRRRANGRFSRARSFLFVRKKFDRRIVRVQNFSIRKSQRKCFNSKKMFFSIRRTNRNFSWFFSIRIESKENSCSPSFSSRSTRIFSNWKKQRKTEKTISLRFDELFRVRAAKSTKILRFSRRSETFGFVRFRRKSSRKRFDRRSTRRKKRFDVRFFLRNEKTENFPFRRVFPSREKPFSGNKSTNVSRSSFSSLSQRWTSKLKRRN